MAEHGRSRRRGGPGRTGPAEETADALAGLVSDGSITQEQADERLAEGTERVRERRDETEDGSGS